VSVKRVSSSAAVFNFVNGPPDPLARYTLYPETPEEALGFQVKLTSWFPAVVAAEGRLEVGLADEPGTDAQLETVTLAASATKATMIPKRHRGARLEWR
jgi:hypothetical protein